GELVGFYARLEAAVIVVAFEAPIVGGELRTSREALEVRPFAPADIPWSGIAFKTSYYVLADWLANTHPDVPAGPPIAHRYPAPRRAPTRNARRSKAIAAPSAS